MTANTRKFVIGSSAVLVAGLCTGLIAYYGGLPTGAFARQMGPAELAYVPSDAAVVAFADVREVMNSEMRHKLQEVMPPEDKGREEFKAKTGIDIETDIDHVVACVLPREGQESGFVALRGRFDAVRLESLARQHNAVIEEYKGKRFIRIPEELREHGDAPEGSALREHRGGRHITPALAFLEPGLIMVGDAAAIRLAIDTQAAGQDVTDNSEVMQLIKGMDAGANAWAVGRFDILASRAKLPEGVASQIPAVKWFAAAGRINGGLSGVLRAEARDEQAAQNLRDVINGFVALGRLQAGNRPEFQSLMQSVTLGGSGKTVELSFTVPTELIDMLQNLAGHKRAAPAGN
jgi:hypothetical protein